MPLALEQIRRMRGGARAQLMRCDDEAFYVVKFQNNPQGTRILANELLGTRLAARLGLPVPAAAVVEVRENLIRQTEDLVIQLPRGHMRCAPGHQFGSRFPVAPAETVVFDFLPDEQLRSTINLADFCGMLVFDKWTCNTNGRQAIFFCSRGEQRYRALMIDQGFCFNAGEWNFPDAPLRGLYARHRILGKLERGVRVEEFTRPGDPLRLDYAYRYNGTRGYLHAVALGRDPSQAKVLAYTAEQIRARAAHSEFTAITEVEPSTENPRDQFVARLFAEQRIAVVPLNRVEMFAESLRSRLQ